MSMSILGFLDRPIGDECGFALVEALQSSTPLDFFNDVSFLG